MLSIFVAPPTVGKASGWEDSESNRFLGQTADEVKQGEC